MLARPLLCTRLACPLLSSAPQIGTSSVVYNNRWLAKRVVDLAPASLRPHLQLTRVDKPIGTWLLYWPCTWSIALAAPAGSLPNLTCLTLFGVGAVCMRGAGCVINDLWDVDFDRKVERTKFRPLASSVLTKKQAVFTLAGLLSVSLVILLQFNWLTVAIGTSSLLLVISYPLAKRFTHWPQAVLGLTFNFGAIMGYTAAAEHFSAVHILPLYAASICWTLVYDTIYAHQDKADDLLINVKSTALRFGAQTKSWLTGFSALMIGNLYLLGELTAQPAPYYLGLVSVTAHLAWQISTVDIDNSEDCWEKFKSNAWIGPMFLSGILLANLLRKKDDEVGDE